MAQDITLLGATYSAVPAVTLPKSGGGEATFVEAEEVFDRLDAIDSELDSYGDIVTFSVVEVTT